MIILMYHYCVSHVPQFPHLSLFLRPFISCDFHNLHMCMFVLWFTIRLEDVSEDQGRICGGDAGR